MKAYKRAELRDVLLMYCNLSVFSTSVPSFSLITLIYSNSISRRFFFLLALSVFVMFFLYLITKKTCKTKYIELFIH